MLSKASARSMFGLGPPEFLPLIMSVMRPVVGAAT
jgi:hypothetical protein